MHGDRSPESKNTAAAAAAATFKQVLAELAELGGHALTVRTTRSSLTWSTHSIQTHDEYDHDKNSGTHGPTGRHRASVNVLISVRDFALLDGVGGLLTSRDAINVHSVSWSVDDDNPDWALVRADAIQAALRKGQDYASALGGSVVRVEQVADAGLLGGETSGRMSRQSSGAYYAPGRMRMSRTAPPSRAARASW